MNMDSTSLREAYWRKNILKKSKYKDRKINLKSSDTIEIVPD
jgi:hypothetical protein